MVRCGVSEAISPFAEQCLDHSFSLAVGPRGVRSGADVPDAELAARCGKQMRAISIAVVGQQSSNEDATLGEPSYGSAQEADRGPFSLAAEHFHVCHSRSVIDANVSELPSGSWSMSAVAGNAMPYPIDPPELLHVDVEQISRTTPFVSARRRRRVEAIQARQTGLTDDSSDRGATETERLSNLSACQSLSAQRHDQ